MSVTMIWHSYCVEEHGLHSAYAPEGVCFAIIPYFFHCWILSSTAACQLNGWLLLPFLPSNTIRGIKYVSGLIQRINIESTEPLTLGSFLQGWKWRIVGSEGANIANEDEMMQGEHLLLLISCRWSSCVWWARKDPYGYLGSWCSRTQDRVPSVVTWSLLCF